MTNEERCCSALSFTAVLLLTGYCGAFAQAPRDDVLGIEQLRAMARNRPLISSLQLTYAVFQEPSSHIPSAYIPYISRSVLVDAVTGRFSMDRAMEIEGTERGTGTQAATLAFDGEIQTAFLPDPMIGVLKEGADVDGLVESGLWGVMLLSDPQPGGLGIDDASLESLLAQGIVREELERVGDTSCHVVDALYEDTRYATVWLDVERGLLPMKRVGYGSDGTVTSTVTVDSVVFLEDEQIWLPERWTTEIRAHGETLRTDTVVDAESIELNPPITDEDFRPEFPPGTIVTDDVAGLTYRIADSGQIGEVLYERVNGEWASVAPPPATEGAGPRGPSPPAPLLESLADLLELAASPQAGRPRPARTETDASTEAASPVATTERRAPESRPAERSLPTATAPADVTVVDHVRTPHPMEPPETVDGNAAGVPSSKSMWPWLAGITVAVALLAFGYAVAKYRSWV